jgi:hypothetical protein
MQTFSSWMPAMMAVVPVLAAAATLAQPGTGGDRDGAVRVETIAQPSAADAERTEGPTEGAVLERVRGAELPPVEASGDAWVWASDRGRMSTGAPLPVGYPAPTPPGAVEVKRYPTVRRAEADGSSGLFRGQGGPFWRLFLHIEQRDIAMTAPVEMDYGVREEDGQTLPDLNEWTMSFLYRDADLGPTGDAERGVRVVDAEPVVVLSMGMRGDPSRADFAEAFAELESIAAGLEAWRVGELRRSMGYNGPDTPRRMRWWEAQIELVPAESAPADSTPAATDAAATNR